MTKRRVNLSIGVRKEHRSKVSRHNKNRNIQSRKAFTIAEFIIVVVVIGILMAVLGVVYLNFLRRASELSVRAELNNGVKQLKVFQAVNSTYPKTVNCDEPDSLTNKCIKSKSGAVYKYVTKSTDISVFCLGADNNGIRYSVSQDNVIMAGPCPMLSLNAANELSYNGVGNTWYDISGHGKNGNLSGVTYSVQNGGIFSFDGVNDFVSSDYVSGTNSDMLTVSTWIRPGSTNGTYEISNQGQWSTGPWVGWQFRQIGKTINFKLSDGTSNTYECSGGSLSSNAWHYVSGSWDGSYIRIYVDGAETAKCAESIDFRGSEGVYTIGKYAGSSYYFNGVLGSVGVYDDALTGSEILQNYNFTKSRYGL